MTDTLQRVLVSLISDVTHYDDYRLIDLLSICVGRVSLISARRGEDWEQSLRSIDLRHISDWIKTAIINDEPWLSNVDHMGYPKKLMKFGTFQDIVNEADKAMFKANQRNGSVDLVEGDEELFMELEDGYRLVRLLTTAALDREGKEMQHCIGGGAYDETLLSDRFMFLSLRDKNNKAHATLEIAYEGLSQFQGKQNKPPKPEYALALKPFFRDFPFTIDLPLIQLGYVVSAQGDIYDFHDLADNLKFKGSLDFSGIDISKLPKNLTIEGDLIIHSQSFTELPNGLNVRGSLNVSGTSINSIPEDIIIGGSLTAVNTMITKLPPYLKIVGSLALCGSKINYLPNGLVIGGNLVLGDTCVRELPDDLTVGGDLFLSGSQVSAIPPKMKIGGGIVSKSGFGLFLPEGLNILGDLILQNSQIGQLPENLHVGGVLDIRNTGLTTLPSGLRVDKNLLLDGSVSALPEDLYLGGELDIQGSPSDTLLASIKDDAMVRLDFRRLPGAEYKYLWCMGSLAQKSATSP